MTQRRSRRRFPIERSAQPQSPGAGSPARVQKHRSSRQWRELDDPGGQSSPWIDLTALIEQDAPLKSHTGLVLMYGPFQAEMHSDQGQGVASWLRDCVRKHGIPSLMRLDYRHRVQVFRRDQFQSWLEPLMPKIS